MWDPASEPAEESLPEDILYGLLDVSVRVSEPGGFVALTFHLAEPAPEGFVWVGHDEEPGWTDFSSHAVFNASRDRVTVTLEDGGDCDEDGAANGVIKKRLALGRLVSPDGLEELPAEESGGSGGRCFLELLGSRPLGEAKIIRR